MSTENVWIARNFEEGSRILEADIDAATGRTKAERRRALDDRIEALKQRWVAERASVPGLTFPGK